MEVVFEKSNKEQQTPIWEAKKPLNPCEALDMEGFLNLESLVR